MTMERDSLVARLRDAEEALWHRDLYVLAEACREAAAALSRPEQVVKALEWQKPVTSGTMNRADTILGYYRVWTHYEANGEWFWSIRLAGTDAAIHGECDSEAAAKAAAQADYESRIRSCLTTAAPLQADASAPASPAIGAREAFKAGWWTNAAYDHPAEYLSGCEEADWSEYQKKGLDTYVTDLLSAAREEADTALHPAPSSRPAIGVQAATERLMRLIDEKLCIVWWPADKRAQFAELVSAALHPAPEAASAGAAVERNPTNDQIAAVMLQHGTEGQRREALAYAGIAATSAPPSDTAPSPKGVSDGVRDVLQALRDANVSRQADWCPEQVPDLSFRGVELAGEAGEVCNVIKKLERERLGWRGSRDTIEHLAEELADVVICADLIGISAGINLWPAIVAKFNATSEKVGLPHRLAALSQEPVPSTAEERAASEEGA